MSYPICLKKINSFEFIRLFPASLSALLKHQLFCTHQQTAGLCFPTAPAAAQAVTAPGGTLPGTSFCTSGSSAGECDFSMEQRCYRPYLLCVNYLIFKLVGRFLVQSSQGLHHLCPSRRAAWWNAHPVQRQSALHLVPGEAAHLSWIAGKRGGDLAPK